LKHSTAQPKAFTEKGLYMGTESTFEINFAVMKFRHTIKKEKKAGTTQDTIKPNRR
jgi:hypothetical protein